MVEKINEIKTEGDFGENFKMIDTDYTFIIKDTQEFFKCINDIFGLYFPDNIHVHLNENFDVIADVRIREVVKK